MEENPTKKDAESGIDHVFYPLSFPPNISNLTFLKRIEFCCLRNKIRIYMILEVFVSISMIFLLSNSYYLTYRVEKAHELLARIQAQIANMDKPLGSPCNPIDTTISLIFPATTEPPEVEPSSVLTVTQKLSGVFNAANFFSGASVDTKHSSESDNLESFSKRDQSDYVLLDRENPPPNKAWCSDDKEPHLTIRLSKHINPTSVSYQHTKWNGTVPDGAPKIYDLVGCNDRSCDKWEPLAMNCTYTSNANETQEQHCPIAINETHQYGFNKVQIRYRENHGNVEKTCAYVVRVYGVSSKIPVSKEELERSKEICKDLAWHYHNSPFVYNTFDYKNCSILYSNHCCHDCPECCEQCEIHDMNFESFTLTLLLFLIGLLFFTVVSFMIYMCLKHPMRQGIVITYSENNAI